MLLGEADFRVDDSEAIYFLQFAVFAMFDMLLYYVVMIDRAVFNKGAHVCASLWAHGTKGIAVRRHNH